MQETGLLHTRFTPHALCTRTYAISACIQKRKRKIFPSRLMSRAGGFWDHRVEGQKLSIGTILLHSEFRILITTKVSNL